MIINKQKTAAIILAAGMGNRMNLGYNKIFYNFKKPLICYTIDVFEKSKVVDEIILVVAKNEENKFKEIINNNNYQKISKIFVGGETRQDSSRIGVENCDAEIVLIHDGARPFIKQETITKSVEATKKFGASIFAVPCKDTVKLAQEDKIIDKTLNRTKIWMAQTPQTFFRDLILEAHTKAKAENFIGTDEASLLEKIGKKVKLVMGSYDNIKVTTEEDLLLAKLIIKKHNL